MTHGLLLTFSLRSPYLEVSQVTLYLASVFFNMFRFGSSSDRDVNELPTSEDHSTVAYTPVIDG